MGIIPKFPRHYMTADLNFYFHNSSTRRKFSGASWVTLPNSSAVVKGLNSSDRGSDKQTHLLPEEIPRKMPVGNDHDEEILKNRPKIIIVLKFYVFQKLPGIFDSSTANQIERIPRA